MTVETMDRLIAPHGGTLVDRTGDAPRISIRSRS